MNYFKFLIIGSDLPALISASILSKYGPTVVIEENKYIRHKSDSFIIKRNLEVENRFVEKKFNKIELITEKEREYINTEVIRINEFLLRKHILKSLLKRKVQIKTGEKITSVGKNTLTTNRSKYKFDVLISSDNCRKINSALNIKEEYYHELVISRNVKSKNVKLYLLHKIGGVKFIWVLPYKKETKVIFGFDNYDELENVKRFAQIFLDSNVGGKTTDARIRRIRKNLTESNKENIILIGDSEGVGCCLTGEKNYYFIRSSMRIEEKLLGYEDDRITRDKKLCELISKKLNMGADLDFNDLQILKILFSKND